MGSPFGAEILLPEEFSGGADAPCEQPLNTIMTVINITTITYLLMTRNPLFFRLIQLQPPLILWECSGNVFPDVPPKPWRSRKAGSRERLRLAPLPPGKGILAILASYCRDSGIIIQGRLFQPPLPGMRRAMASLVFPFLFHLARPHAFQ
jgi:hypothetical protein